VKLVTAVLRAGQFDEVVQAAIGAGAHGLTATEVRGFGQQYGHPEAPIVPCGRDSLLEPKLRIDMVVQDETAASLLEDIAKAINAGNIGGGEIWVSPVESVLRVRTGEHDRDAVLRQETAGDVRAGPRSWKIMTNADQPRPFIRGCRAKPRLEWNQAGTDEKRRAR
jgi:nitrogen regulatory protein P-II 1